MNNGTEKTLALPGSSYDVIAKILHAYALCGDTPANLDTVAAKAAMDKTLVSRNNGFLVSLGLLTEGKAKTLTADGKKLAVAIGHNLEEDAALEWRRIFLSAPAAKSVVDMLKVQKEVPVAALPGRIAATLGQPSSTTTTTGVNSLIEILTSAGVIREQDGRYRLIAQPNESASQAGASTEPSTLNHPGSMETKVANQAETAAGNSGAKFGTIPIHVNIELHLPASSEQSVYDALFKSIRENLLS
jgi:hypothetical protein